MEKYDYTKAEDLVKWAKEEYKKPNIYKNGGIGRYNSDGTRQFDCCGFFKCFMWHDYSTKNAKYYGKTQRDLNCEGLLSEAKEKGDINSIPEIPGVLVYMKKHMGIYLGNGKVLEATAKKYDGKNGKVYLTYFKGDGKDTDGKRTTWTKWFKSPNLVYDSDFFEGKGCFKKGDRSNNIGKVAEFIYDHSFESKKILGNYYGPYLEDAIRRFQQRAKEENIYDDKVDGILGPKTLKSLVDKGAIF